MDSLDSVVRHAEFMGMSVIAICDADSHVTMMPVSAVLLDDLSMARIIVADAVENLLEKRSLSREQGGENE